MITTHTDRFQFLPELAPDEYEALKADIRTNGVLVPVEVDEHGTTLDGHHRVRIWHELRAEGSRIHDYPRIVRRLTSDDDKLEHALKMNLNRRHLLGRDQLKDLAVRLWDEQDWGYQRIAGALGIAVGTAHAWVTSSPTFQNRKVDDRRPVGADGKTRPTTYTRRVHVSVLAKNEKEQKAALKAIESLYGDDADVPDADVITPADPASCLPGETPTPAPFEDAMAQHDAWLAAIRGDIERMESLADLRRICDTLETTAGRMEALGIDPAETRRVHILAMRNRGRVIGIVIDAAFDAAREALTATSPTASQLRGWKDAIVAALDLIHPDVESPNDLQQFIDALKAIDRWCNELADLMEDALQGLREEMEKKRKAMTA